MKHIQFHSIDFIAPPAWSKPVLLALMMLLGTLVTLAWKLHHTHQSVETLQNAITHYHAWQQHITPPAVVLDIEQEQRILKEYAALQTLHQSLLNPLHVLGALELCVNQDVVFLAVRPQRSSPDVSLQMEVRDINHVKSALECLSDTEQFEQVHLLGQQRVLEDPQQPLKIDVLTRIHH